MIHSRRPLWRNGFFFVNTSSEHSHSESHGDVVPETPKVSMPVTSSPWGPPKNQDTACSWECIVTQLPPSQPRSTCERLELPFSCDAVLSGYEDLVSSGSDQFTTWGKMSPQEILVGHVVDIYKVVANFSDAYERVQSSLSQAYGVNKYFSSQSLVQKRLSIYNWKPGPRRGGKDAVEKQIAGKWHIITLQEARGF